tara:strand:+ start:375 stop:1508 length:1134 start_codon:yes stop_codon:yes gene_type:complete
MHQSKDCINSSKIVFEYKSKKLAVQCNDIIETIFNTQIVPKLEEVIIHKIPKGVDLHIDTIELDIGNIKANEFHNELALRIKNAFENALESKLSLLQDSTIDNTLKTADKTSYYLLSALEFYMVSGYFPSWFDTGKSLDGLISTLMESSKDDFFQMLGKYSINEAAMSRLKNILSLKIYNEIYPLVKSNSLQAPKKLLNKNTKVSMENDFTDEIRVNNAGLIIFWPFLTRLFEQLNLVENGLFISKSARNRAIYLLQYMVNNTTDDPEFELVLNKILVGMPISEHLDPIENLSLEEKNMTVSLINGLIANWEKVRDASPAAIQETFVQREGFLLIKEENMHLKINKKGVDVLLMSIPWNLSLIKLPWMEKPLHIEWV